MMKRMMFVLFGAALVMPVAPGAKAARDANAEARAQRLGMLDSARSGGNLALLTQQEAMQADRESAQEQSEAQQDAQEREQDARERARDAREHQRDAREHDEDRYENGLDAIDESKWEQALDNFVEIVRDNAPNADAALYWSAYCQDKLGRRADALSSIADLERKFPQSRWQNDAKALELQVRHETGQPVPPQSESDEELKLLAINGLMQTDLAQAMPLLEKVLNGTGTPRVKERALFVLAQSGSPEAKQKLLTVAEGNANPELQRKAVQYLGLYGGTEGREALGKIYASSNDEEVRREVLHSLMLSGDRERLYEAAQSEKDPDLQREAVQILGVSGARDDLWKLYRSGPPEEVREAVLQAMFVAGDVEHLTELAKTEMNPDLRIKAIRCMGLVGSDRTGAALVAMYPGKSSTDVSKAVLEALFLQGNAQAIVDIAKKENDPYLKKSAVERLSLMHSKVATDYLLEILNK